MRVTGARQAKLLQSDCSDSAEATNGAAQRKSGNNHAPDNGYGVGARQGFLELLPRRRISISVNGDIGHHFDCAIGRRERGRDPQLSQIKEPGHDDHSDERHAVLDPAEQDEHVSILEDAPDQAEQDQIPVTSTGERPDVDRPGAATSFDVEGRRLVRVSAACSGASRTRTEVEMTEAHVEIRELRKYERIDDIMVADAPFVAASCRSPTWISILVDAML